MTGYRLPSCGQALATIAMVASFVLRPPDAADGRITVFDNVLRSGWWTVLFLVPAVWILVTAAAQPRLIFLGHTALIPITLSFGVANFGVSLYNDTGWIIASLCASLTCGHLIAIRCRTVASL